MTIRIRVWLFQVCVVLEAFGRLASSNFRRPPDLCLRSRSWADLGIARTGSDAAEDIAVGATDLLDLKGETFWKSLKIEGWKKTNADKMKCRKQPKVANRLSGNRNSVEGYSPALRYHAKC